ncbi:MAG: formylglycine-generating enzyme family protein [Bacteroidia bacterium]
MRLFLLYLFFIPMVSLFAQQGKPCDYNLLMKQGDQLYRTGDYRAALKKYNAARVCDPGKSPAVDDAIDKLFTAIEKQRDEAERLRRVAETEKKKAQAALLAVEEATVQIVQTLLRDASEDILYLRYEDAVNELHSAARLVQDKVPGSPLDQIRPDVGRALMEPAFFYAETGKYPSAAAELRLADSLINKGKISSWTTNISDKDTTLLSRFRKTLSSLDSTTYQSLRLRYYPDMVEVKGGTFWMGDENAGSDEKPEHPVTLSDFFIARTEVTFWQYNLYLEATGIREVEDLGPLSWGIIGDNPVVNVSWGDTKMYTDWLNKQMGTQSYHLPTEAEWEYAAGGGSADRDSTSRRKYEYSGGDTLSVVGWHYENSRNRTQPVGRKRPNGLGIYDMSGNVWEWCEDWYDDTYYQTCFYEGIVLDPENTNFKSSRRVLRGGSWLGDANYCRASYRLRGNPDGRNNNVGFRVARD